MPKVTFLPLGKVVEAEMNESILDVAIRHDIPLQHACGGFCSCTTCHIHVKTNPAALSSMEEDENERIDWVDARLPESRLGCQAKVNSDVTVQIMNLDE